jgi:hypothetical protein
MHNSTGTHGKSLADSIIQNRECRIGVLTYLYHDVAVVAVGDQRKTEPPIA